MIIKINHEVLEESYCKKHHKWCYFDDEMNCCEQERERQLIEQDDFIKEGK